MTDSFKARSTLASGGQNYEYWNLLALGAAVRRTDTELVLKSRRVVPGRFEHAGQVRPSPCLERCGIQPGVARRREITP